MIVTFFPLSVSPLFIKELYMSKNITSDKYQSGFTLVEILVAMVILLIVITACYPLFTMATKTTHENRARLIASELAKKEIEKTLAEVTASNYNSEDPDAPLRTSGTNTFVDISGHPGYKMKKTVEWVDDPDDGIYPADKIPFDYKQLIVEVSYPSLFSNTVVHKSDFKTFIAREGTASPTVGLVVEVEELLDAIPNTEIVTVANVNITNLDTGEEDSAITNDKGLAFFKVEFPDDVAEYNYEVSVESSGLIMDPNPAHMNRQIVPQDETAEIKISMAKPGSITVKCKTPVSPSVIGLSGDHYYETINITESDLGSTAVNKTFNNLWPFGAYEITSLMTVHKADLNDAAISGNFKEAPEDEDAIVNLWNLRSAETPVNWTAEPGFYNEESFAEKNYLEYQLDLSAFEPSSSVQVSSFMSPLSEDKPILNMTNDCEASDFAILYMNKNTGNSDINNPNDWVPLVDIDGYADLVSPYNIILADDKAVLSNIFTLLFESSRDITKYVINSFYIACQYKGNVTLNTPGENFILNINK